MYKLSKRFTIIIITITVGLSAQGQQPTEWAVLSHIKCLSQCEVVRFQVILHSLEPC